jgi:ABC-2 type transport system permease protein
MAVYRRGYQRYQGSLTGRWTRLMVMPRFAWERLLQQRLLVILIVISMFWPLACAGFVYVANHLDLLPSVGQGGAAKLLQIDADFFLVFMNAQAVFAVILAAFAGPSLIAPDLANNALPLYFSRPLSRVDYVLARMMVLVGLLSPVTWVPGLLLFTMQTGMAGWTWFSTNWRLGAGIVAGFMMWIALVGLVALACSAYVKWRIIAGGLVLGFYFILAGASVMMNEILRVSWASMFNPSKAMNQVWRSLLGAESNPGLSTSDCALALAGLAALLLWVLERKLRPVEVVS